METNYEHFDTERLRAIPITEVARRLGDELKREGSVCKTLCPWHDDHDPSLTLYERTGENHCHCFSCGHGGDTIAYVMQHEGWTFQKACRWLSATFGIANAYGMRQPAPRPKQKATPKAEEPPQYTYIPWPMLESLISVENSLCHCLMRMFRPEAVEWLVGEYLIGAYPMNGRDDYTVFPSIDHEGRICNLKVQLYDSEPQSERFAHSIPNTTYWLGTMWAKDGRLPRKSTFCSDCLFGEHLLPRYTDCTVALVESPKNALFGALSFPRYLWLATGNKGALKRKTLEPLRGRNVLVIPDCDALEPWTQTLDGMADLANFTVSDFCRRMAPSGQPKFDIADYLQQQRMLGE